MANSRVKSFLNVCNILDLMNRVKKKQTCNETEPLRDENIVYNLSNLDIRISDLQCLCVV